MNKHSGGFTIVELLLAAIALAISVIAYSTLITSLTVLNDQAKDLTLANGIAENKIETLRSLGFTALSDGTVDFTDELPKSLGNPRSATYTVSTVEAGLKSVKIDINYSDGKKTQELDYASYISELGLSQ